MPFIGTSGIKNVSIISENVSGYDELWILGDNFGARSFRQFFMENQEFFTPQHFETSGHCNSRYTCNITNILVRLSSAFIKAVTSLHKLPKYIVVIIDTDLIDFIKFKTQDEAKLIGLYLNAIVKDIEETIRDRKTQLPKKAVRDKYPLIYWVAVPVHDRFSNNDLRRKFNLCLETIIRITDNMRIIRMKEHWVSDNNELVDQKGGLTTLGLAKYWQSVDASIKFNVTRNELASARKFKQVNKPAQPSMNPPSEPNPLGRRLETISDHMDLMEEIFARRRMNDKHHWDRRNVQQGSNKQAKFILPKPR